MGKKSKDKGSRYELEIAKYLTSKRGFEYFRVGVSSGARATKQGIATNRFKGDVFSDTDLDYQDIMIECKHYKSRVELDDIVNPKSDFNSWIKECGEKSNGIEWILFFKGNQGVSFALTRNDMHKASLFAKTVSSAPVCTITYGTTLYDIVLLG